MKINDSMYVVSRKEAEKIIRLLQEQYGIKTKLPMLVKSGKEKLRVFTGEITKETLRKLCKLTRVETLGLYVASLHHDKLRLSVDGAHFFSNLIKRNVVKVNDEAAKKWMEGEAITITNKISGFVVLKNRNDIIGVGRASEGIVWNFLPKERRVRK